MIDSKLANAYRFHRQFDTRKPMKAVNCLFEARRDVAAGKTRFPSDIYPAVSWQEGERRLAYVQSIDNAGLRYVGRVETECGGRNGYFSKSDDGGWFTDPHGDVFRDGTGLCYGVVYQLPARDGKARFVPGYIMGGCSDDLPTVDFSMVYELNRRDGGYDDQTEYDDCREAARAADNMAKAAAESEREFQTAWQAGQMFANLGDDIKAERKDALKLFKERRLAKAAGLSGETYSAICSMLRASIASSIRTIAKARKARQELAAGDYSKGQTYLGFWTGDPNLRAAFNDGASESVLA